MLIKSQDRKTLINLDNVTQIYIDDENIVTAEFNNSLDYENGGAEDIGTYSTEEKALKVLDNITARYDDLQYFIRHFDSGESVNAVFQMPQEDEV